MFCEFTEMTTAKFKSHWHQVKWLNSDDGNKSFMQIKHTHTHIYTKFTFESEQQQKMQLQWDVKCICFSVTSGSCWYVYVIIIEWLIHTKIMADRYKYTMIPPYEYLYI